MRALRSSQLTLPRLLTVATLTLALTPIVLPAPTAHADAPTPPTSPTPTPAPTAWDAARNAYWSKSRDATKLLGDLAASATESPFARRDALHLLGRLQLDDHHPADAVAAWRAALALTQDTKDAKAAAPSHLGDLLRYGLARALVESGSHDEEPLTLLAAVDKSPYSPLRAEAAFLRARHLETLGRVDEARKAYKSVLERWPDATFTRALKVRLGALEVAGGKGEHARGVLESVAAEAPTSVPGREAELLLASLDNGTAPSRVDAAAVRVPLATIRYWIDERRFDQVGPALAPWLVEPPKDAPKTALSAWLDALELKLDDAWENFRFSEALATSDKLRANKRPGLSKPRETRLFALDGDFDKARAELKKRLRGKAYYAALADMAYEFARYDEAFDAYQKVFGKKKAPTERMVWCLMRMGKADKAVKFWEKLGKTRGFNKNLYERYWYARAQQLAGKPAKALFEALVDDAPLEYYGLQAWSRIQEIDGTVPEGAPPPPLTVAKKDDPATPTTPSSTVAWTEASLAGAFDRAHQPAPIAELAPRVSDFAARWGGTAEEANRAAELAGMGDVQGTLDELRVIDMDMRAARSQAGALGTRARSDLLDNRGSPRAPGGASMRETTNTRKTAEQAGAMKRNAAAIRKELRDLQVMLADPYGMRKSVLEDHWVATPELLAAQGPELYPIAYPDIVKPLSQQFGLPPYFVYAIMTVESAFHPGAVSVSSAYGLVQVIPRTAEILARALGYLDFTPERLLEPAVSIYFGGYYLACLLSRFHGQEPLAAAAYNAGPHRVAVWLMARGKIPMDMFIEDIPYDQARNYTKTVLEHVAAYRRIYHGEDHLYVRNTIDPTMSDGPNY